jgi:pyruvate dehydrogenase E2 component (dihydrolipoamide acetyltransferase)
MASEAEGVKGATEVTELSRVQRAIARRAAEARATVPDIELSADVTLEASGGLQLTAALVRACALALRAVPRANGSYRDERFELHSRINVGVVLAADDEYAIPTVFDAERKSTAALTAELESLAERARTGALTPPELAGATFTLTHVETPGVGRAAAIIIPPQAAAVAAGAMRATPIVRDGAILPGHMLTLTLACDHRILYGEQAARFLSTIKHQLEVGKLV